MPDARMLLTQRQLETLHGIMAEVIPEAEVWLFGSRATGRARPFSDVDLLVERPMVLTWQQRACLRERFEQSDLPFRVDVVEAVALAPGMVKRVRTERLLLRKGRGAPS